MKMQVDAPKTYIFINGRYPKLEILSFLHRKSMDSNSLRPYMLSNLIDGFILRSKTWSKNIMNGEARKTRENSGA